MGLDSLLQVAFPGAGHHNSSSTADRLVTLSPTTLLETFVPGYGPIHTFLLLKFGFDVTVSFLCPLHSASW
jgi:mitochondrial chaperone BCS1